MDVRLSEDDELSDDNDKRDDEPLDEELLDDDLLNLFDGGVTMTGFGGVTGRSSNDDSLCGGGSIKSSGGTSMGYSYEGNDSSEIDGSGVGGKGFC